MLLICYMFWYLMEVCCCSALIEFDNKEQKLISGTPNCRRDAYWMGPWLSTTSKWMWTTGWGTTTCLPTSSTGTIPRPCSHRGAKPLTRKNVFHHLYRAEQKGLLVFEISRCCHPAALGLPGLNFWKIGRKSCNHVQTLKWRSVHSLAWNHGTV